MRKYNFTKNYEKKQIVTSYNRNYVYYYHYIALHLVLHCRKIWRSLSRYIPEILGLCYILGDMYFMQTLQTDKM